MSLRVIHSIDEFVAESKTGSSVTVGTFDGIHLGHQEILRRVLVKTDKDALDPVMVTFHPHPRQVVTPDKAPSLLTTIPEKKKVVHGFFRGTVLVLEFNNELKDMSAQQFVHRILLDKLQMKELVVGYDHAFGRDRGGTIVELKRLGEINDFGVEVVGPVMMGNEGVSSSRIRRCLRENSFQEALALLGHPFLIHGVVERGIGLGRKLGYPTANVAYESHKMLPSEGVYACRVEIGERKHSGMMFIGRNYFNPEERVTVEANLFDFDEDIYGQEITVIPTRFVRANQRFDSKQALVAQIGEDKKQIERIIQQEMRNVS